MSDSGRRLGTLAVAAIAIIGAAILAPVDVGARQQGTTFRAQTEAAWVTATVIASDGQLLTDLKRDDFEIREDGVVRDITTFRSDPIPFAAVVMIDGSGSMDGAAATVHHAMDALIDEFQAGDRARIGSFDTLTYLLGGFTANRALLHRSISDAMSVPSDAMNSPLPSCGDGLPRAGGINNHGWTALWDGIYCGVVSAANDSETPQRVVIVISDGMENHSFMTIPEVVQRAEEAGVMVYAIALAGTDGVAAGDMRGLAEATGGGYFSLSGGETLTSAFAKIGKQLHHQYVLGFTPSTPGDKLHGVTVKALRPDTRTHSRQVYLTTVQINSSTALVPPAATAPSFNAPAATVAAPAAATLPTGSPGPPGTRSPIETTLDRFVTPAWILGQAPHLTIDQLHSLARDLRRDAPRWIAEAPAGDQSRRRLAVGTFVLDVLWSQTDPFLWTSNQPAWDLLDWTEGMLRGGPPSPSEQLWYVNAIGLLERSGVAKELDAFVARAQGRFPNEERWALARGIAQDLKTWPSRRDQGFSPDPSISSLIVSRYQEAAALPSVRQEALLRLGYFELRRGRLDDALARFKEVGEPQDQFLRYWLGLLQGRALEQAGKIDAAVASYEDAFKTVPFARSATVALSAALVAAHREPDARRLAARMLVTTPPPDPWTVYVLPDYRYWGAALDQLHKAVIE